MIQDIMQWVLIFGACGVLAYGCKTKIDENMAKERTRRVFETVKVVTTGECVYDYNGALEYCPAAVKHDNGLVRTRTFLFSAVDGETLVKTCIVYDGEIGSCKWERR